MSDDGRVAFKLIGPKRAQLVIDKAAHELFRHAYFDRVHDGPGRLVIDRMAKSFDAVSGDFVMPITRVRCQALIDFFDAIRWQREDSAEGVLATQARDALERFRRSTTVDVIGMLDDDAG